MKLFSSCLIDSIYTNASITVVSGVGSDRKTVLQYFDIEVTVFVAALGFVPDPKEISVSGGVCIKSCGVRLDDNRGSA